MEFNPECGEVELPNDIFINTSLFNHTDILNLSIWCDNATFSLNIFKDETNQCAFI